MFFLLFDDFRNRFLLEREREREHLARTYTVQLGAKINELISAWYVRRLVPHSLSRCLKPWVPGFQRVKSSWELSLSSLFIATGAFFAGIVRNGGDEKSGIREKGRLELWCYRENHKISPADFRSSRLGGLLRNHIDPQLEQGDREIFLQF